FRIPSRENPQTTFRQGFTSPQTLMVMCYLYSRAVGQENLLERSRFVKISPRWWLKEGTSRLRMRSSRYHIYPFPPPQSSSIDSCVRKALHSPVSRLPRQCKSRNPRVKLHSSRAMLRALF